MFSENLKNQKNTIKIHTQHHIQTDTQQHTTTYNTLNEVNEST